MICKEELSYLNEAELALLLGVSRRMVRKYIKSGGLPCTGTGKLRRFDWHTVREWYLIYRVSIVDHGGQQRATLRQSVGSIRKCAASDARIKTTQHYERRLERGGTLSVSSPRAAQVADRLGRRRPMSTQNQTP